MKQNKTDISPQFQQPHKVSCTHHSKFLTYLSCGALDLSNPIYFSQWTEEEDYRLIVGEIITALTPKLKSSKGCCAEYSHLTFHSHGATEALAMPIRKTWFISRSASELFGEPKPWNHAARSHLSTPCLAQQQILFELELIPIIAERWEHELEETPHHLAYEWLDGSLTFHLLTNFSDFVPLLQTMIIFFASCDVERNTKCLHEYPHLTHFS